MSCFHRSIDAVKELMTDDILSNENSIQAFLTQAVYGGHIDMVKYIMETLHAKAWHDFRHLAHIAIQTNHHDIADYLKKHSTWTIKNFRKRIF